MSQINSKNSAALLRHFSDPEFINVYGTEMKRFLPGCAALHVMTSVLLAERAPTHARVLVLGAGGGLELQVMADANPSWTFVGVDPAPQMLHEARRVLTSRMDRVELIEGYISDAPLGPFDAATCLLTLHFLPESERIATVKEIHKRLRRGAPFVAAHASFAQSQPERSMWLDRYASFAIASGADPEKANKARNAIEESNLALTPEADEAVLRMGGFSDVQQFFSAFTWRGWVGHA